MPSLRGKRVLIAGSAGLSAPISSTSCFQGIRQRSSYTIASREGHERTSRYSTRPRSARWLWLLVLAVAVQPCPSCRLESSADTG